MQENHSELKDDGKSLLTVLVKYNFI